MADDVIVIASQRVAQTRAGDRHCERSEAIHLSARKHGLLRRYAPRNDELNHPIQLSNSQKDARPHSRGAMRPRFAETFAAL
jgi:hypothetical protein